jgi:hypothetical protein
MTEYSSMSIKSSGKAPVTDLFTEITKLLDVDNFVDGVDVSINYTGDDVVVLRQANARDPIVVRAPHATTAWHMARKALEAYTPNAPRPDWRAQAHALKDCQPTLVEIEECFQALLSDGEVSSVSFNEQEEGGFGCFITETGPASAPIAGNGRMISDAFISAASQYAIASDPAQSIMELAKDMAAECTGEHWHGKLLRIIACAQRLQKQPKRKCSKLDDEED